MGFLKRPVSICDFSERYRKGIEMPPQQRKMSEIMQEMAERLLRDPQAVHTSEALHVALFFANLAWNESIGLASPRKNSITPSVRRMSLRRAIVCAILGYTPARSRLVIKRCCMQ